MSEEVIESITDRICRETCSSGWLHWDSFGSDIHFRGPSRATIYLPDVVFDEDAIVHQCVEAMRKHSDGATAILAIFPQPEGALVTAYAREAF